jgi:NAD(P)-dependent dehydrogenase (short-subunit alcohol dehydrogenase family)
MQRDERKTVVITGASSGIGCASALLLAQRNFRVFAGVRKAGDGEALRAQSDAIVPIIIDVTDHSSIAAAQSAVRTALDDRGLNGLVNNAGIAMPFGGAPCGSKAAFSAISDALRLELRPDGIHVCLIEPGAIHTPAVAKTLGDSDAVIAALPPEGRARYGERLREFMRIGRARETNGSPASVVAEAVHRALTAQQPRLRDPVGAHAKGMVTLTRVLSDRMLDQLRLRVLGMPTQFGAG